MKRKRRKAIRGILLAGFFWGAIAAGVFSIHYKVPEAFWERVLPLPKGDWVSILIEPGMNGRQVAEAFSKQGALNGEPEQLAYWMARLKLDRRIRPGRYRVIRSSAWQLARQLRTARPALLKMTVIPGVDIFSLRGAIPLSEDQKGQDTFRLAVMNDENYPREMRPLLPDDEESRIVFLFPETYYVVERTAQDLVRAASTAWWGRFRAEVLMFPDAERRRKLREAAVVASMVEREVLRDSECPRVAGVIYNRLKRGMPLQIDATVVYAWKLAGRKVTRVLNSDLAINSPYNTYLQPGLPPRPICIPGEAAWEAALDPEKNEYYYYVARKSGYHYFAKTYSEHLENIRRSRSER